MRLPTATAATLLASVLLCACASSPQPPATSPEPAATDLEQARAIAQKVPANLLAVLTDELARGGAEGAIEACRVKAPEMARAASEQTGWNVRRASLRNRNPKGVPDDWERAALERFDARVAAGDNPASLESYQIVTEGGKRYLRYAKALPTQGLCLQCHGAPEVLGDPVNAKLKALYPLDRAVGYSVGQVRGGLFLKKAL
jgi:hypothetical protein